MRVEIVPIIAILILFRIPITLIDLFVNYGLAIAHDSTTRWNMTLAIKFVMKKNHAWLVKLYTLLVTGR